MRMLLSVAAILALSISSAAPALDITVQIFRDEYVRNGRAMMHNFLTLRDHGVDCGGPNGMGQMVGSAMSKIITDFQEQSSRLVRAIDEGDKNAVTNGITELEKANADMDGKQQMVIGILSDQNPQCGKALHAFLSIRAIAPKLPDCLKQIVRAL